MFCHLFNLVQHGHILRASRNDDDILPRCGIFVQKFRIYYDVGNFDEYETFEYINKILFIYHAKRLFNYLIMFFLL